MTGTSNTSDSQANTGLQLTTPPQESPPANSVFTNLKDAGAWFEALPMANVGETAKQIYQGLNQFNRISLPDETRVKIVELFHKPVDFLVTSFEKHYLNQPLPLDTKSRKTATLSITYNSELANSYKILIKGLLAGGNGKDKKQLLVYLYRAMHFLFNAEISCALAYTKRPANLWKELHGIYSYCAQNNLHQLPINNGATKSKDLTIESYYHQILLFGAEQPHRLRQYQIKQIIDHLADWSSKMVFVPNHDRKIVDGRFNIDLRDDRPPIQNALKPPSSSLRYMTFDLNPLAEYLREEFKTSPWEGTLEMQGKQGALGRHLLRSLIVGFIQSPDREQRTEHHLELHLAVGLKQIYGLSLPDKEEEPEEEEPKPKKKQSSWLQGTTPQEPKTNEIWPPPAKDEPIHDPYSVTTCNESMGGYCIRWEGDELPKIKVGELIGIQATNDEKLFALATIRWLEQTGENSLVVGMQLHSAKSTPASINTQKDDEKTKIDCLLLPPASKDSDETSFITSATHLKKGQSLWLKTDEGDRKIEIEYILESTGAFIQYQFKITEDITPKEEPEEQKSSGPGSEFDEIWDDL